MARYVAFLRAVNVGGHVVKMEVLRALFEELHFGGVETFLASGNVIFESKSDDVAAMAAKIEKELQQALGYEVSTFVRTVAEVAAIAAEKPFKPEAIEAAQTFCVALLAGPLDAERRRKLAALISAEDDFQVGAREIYWLGKKGQGKSAVSNAVLERALGVRMTLRGMSTMQKLAARHSPASPSK